jgi:hypothetical protein
LTSTLLDFPLSGLLGFFVGVEVTCFEKKFKKTEKGPCRSDYLLCSSGFTMKESINNMTIDSMNNPPNIERGILKIGSPWRTRFEGRASA